jgi:hypothetical protein
MNAIVENPISYWLSGSLRWFKSPRLLSSQMPTEVIPQGLVSLELKVAGWGWLQLHGTGNREPSKWFWRNQDFTLFIQVGSKPILTLGNLWGTHHYQVDATAGREEVWIPHGTHFQLRLPDLTSTYLPKSILNFPSDCWRAAGINASGSSHWLMHLPSDRADMLSNHSPSLTSTNLRLGDWRTNIPMNDLDHRVMRAGNTD